ncbi:MAG: PAS domain S-box protein, partial [Gammaproteobacteria bacterium]|nr:PAS domain S-box protein [Gammaproteobacteria bacterium]
MSLRRRFADAYRFTRRLSVRLSLLVSLLVSFTILAYGWHTATQQTAHLDQAVRTHTTVLADSIAETVIPLVVVQDLAVLEDQVLRYNLLPGVLAIRVSDRSGRVLSETRINEEGSPIPVYAQDARTRNNSARPAARIRLNADGDLVVWAPIVSGETIGNVEITHSLAEVRAVRPQILFETSLAALVAIAANLTLLWLYLRRPLRAVRLAATFSAELNTRRGDEIAVNAETEEIEQLQKSLNFASRQLWDEQRALEESNERLEAVLAYTADGILTFDEEGRIESFNPAAERIFGSQIEQRADVLLPDWRRQEPHARHEIRARRADGTSFPADVTISEMWVGNRRLYAATVRDLSDAKKLERLSSRLGRILEHAANEIYIFDAASLRFIQASDGALNNLGYHLDDLTGMTPL